MFQVHDFYCKNTQIYEAWPPKGVEMGEGILVVAPLGAPLAPQSSFAAKSASKMLQKWSQGCKIDPQSGAKVAHKVEISHFLILIG